MVAKAYSDLLVRMRLMFKGRLDESVDDIKQRILKDFMKKGTKRQKELAEKFAAELSEYYETYYDREIKRWRGEGGRFIKSAAYDKGSKRWRNPLGRFTKAPRRRRR